MDILLALASLSGNTRQLAHIISSNCRDAGHTVRWLETDISPYALLHDLRLRGHKCYDLYLFGTWTDNVGKTPAEMKQFIVEFIDAVGKPPRVAVFGTGETQWGQEYYCGAVHRVAEIFSSEYPRLLIEQMPHGEKDAQTISQWVDAVLARATQEISI